VLDRDCDPLVAEFAALRTAVVCRPPGAAVVRQALRRRRQRAAAGAASLAVLVVASFGAAVAGIATPPRHLSAALPEPAASGAVAGSPGLLPTASPVLPGPSAPDAAIPPPPVSPSSQCRRYGAVLVDTPMQTSVSVRVDQNGPYPLCPGERVRVFVATYSVDSSGVQHLFKSVTGTVDTSHNPLTLPTQVPPCHVTIYVISGNQQVKSQIPAMSDFYKQAPNVYYSTAAGPYGGVVWLQEEDPCAGSGHPATPPRA
jgi:hypothetical protein